MTILHETFLSNESRESFLVGCVRLAKCDGVISPEEQKFIIDAANGLQIPESGQKELFLMMNDPASNFKLNFETREQKLLFIKEALALCYADGVFRNAEKKEVLKFAEEIGISGSAVEKIDKWVIQGMEWARQGNHLLATLE